MIIFGNRKASKLEAYARNGSPTGWRIIGPHSILEVGCGYGKLLRELRRRLDVPLVGVDFSPTQLRAGSSFPGRARAIAP